MSRNAIKGKKGDEKKDELLDSTGRPVNEYIPKFIAQAPWYVQSENEVQLFINLYKNRKKVILTIKQKEPEMRLMIKWILGMKEENLQVKQKSLEKYYFFLNIQFK